MSPRVKYGLIAGAIGFFLTACTATFVGLCGPFASIAAGALAGFLTGREEVTGSQGESAQAGAISGAIAGAFSLVGQLAGGIAVLTILPAMGFQPAFGQIPSEGDTAGQLGYWAGGIGVGFCIGFVGLALSAGAGAAVAYLMHRPQMPASPQM